MLYGKGEKSSIKFPDRFPTILHLGVSPLWKCIRMQVSDTTDKISNQPTANVQPPTMTVRVGSECRERNMDDIYIFITTGAAAKFTNIRS